MAAQFSLSSQLKPRERLSIFGAANLEISELLALILGTGTKKHNVLHLANLLIKQFPFDSWPTVSADELQRVAGIGPARTAQFLALTELLVRYKRRHSGPKVLATRDVLPLVSGIRHQHREHMVALYLNARGELLKQSTISVGSLNQTVLHPRDVYAEAVTLPCTHVVVVHNHPSDDPLPSQDDLQFTQVLAAAGELLGIRLIDHLIVSPNRWYSLREHGHIQP